MNKILDSEIIEKEIKKILQKNSDITYGMKSSNTTLSIYLRLYLGDCKHTLRISDHLTKKTDVKTLLIQKNTKLKTVINFINSGIKTLRLVHFQKVLKNL